MIWCQLIWGFDIKLGLNFNTCYIGCLILSLIIKLTLLNKSFWMRAKTIFEARQPFGLWDGASVNHRLTKAVVCPSLRMEKKIEKEKSPPNHLVPPDPSAAWIHPSRHRGSRSRQRRIRTRPGMPSPRPGLVPPTTHMPYRRSEASCRRLPHAGCRCLEALCAVASPAPLSPALVSIPPSLPSPTSGLLARIHRRWGPGTRAPRWGRERGGWRGTGKREAWRVDEAWVGGEHERVPDARLRCGKREKEKREVRWKLNLCIYISSVIRSIGLKWAELILGGGHYTMHPPLKNDFKRRTVYSAPPLKIDYFRMWLC